MREREQIALYDLLTVIVLTGNPMLTLRRFRDENWENLLSDSMMGGTRPKRVQKSNWLWPWLHYTFVRRSGKLGSRVRTWLGLSLIHRDAMVVTIPVLAGSESNGKAEEWQLRSRTEMVVMETLQGLMVSHQYPLHGLNESEVRGVIRELRRRKALIDCGHQEAADSVRAWMRLLYEVLVGVRMSESFPIDGALLAEFLTVVLEKLRNPKFPRPAKHEIREGLPFFLMGHMLIWTVTKREEEGWTNPMAADVVAMFTGILGIQESFFENALSAFAKRFGAHGPDTYSPVKIADLLEPFISDQSLSQAIERAAISPRVLDT